MIKANVWATRYWACWSFAKLNRTACKARYQSFTSEGDLRCYVIVFHAISKSALFMLKNACVISVTIHAANPYSV